MDETFSIKAYHIGARIRETRKSLGLRQSDLAERTGLPASHLSDIERGVLVPTIPTLHRIGHALGRPIEYFLQEYGGRPRSMGMVIHATSIGGLAASRFAQRVEEQTHGQVKLCVYHHAALGTAWEQLRGLAEGAIHLYIDEPLSFELYAELCGPVFLPYFFQDRDHYYRFLSSPLMATEIHRKLLNHGIRLLNPVSNWECGSFELLFSKEPIFTPEDLKGRKWRSYASKAAVALRQALGAEPVVVEWEQIDEAFRNDSIDTVLVPAAYFSSLELCNWARHATFLSYGYTLNLTVAMNESEYRKLPPNIQHVLVKAVEETGLYCSQLAREQTVLDLQKLVQVQGVPVIYPSQELWRDRFTAAIRQICDQGLMSRELFEEIQRL
ncbi:MAG: TRAP transporter substrate-binding protein DctP [Anaerolineae bacterium]